MPLRRRFSVRSQLCCDTKHVFLSFKSLDELKKAGPGTFADPRMGGLRPAPSNSNRIVIVGNSNRISRTLGTNLKNEIKQWNAFVCVCCVSLQEECGSIRVPIRENKQSKFTPL